MQKHALSFSVSLAERNAGETSSRLGANTVQLVEYSKILHGENPVIEDYYERLFSMKSLHLQGDLTHVQIRDFILLMIITSGNGSRLDALMNLTVKEWKKRYQRTDEDRTTCVVNIYQHKTDVDGPVRLVFDERLETVTELYRLHIRPIYVKEHKDPGTLFVTQQGKQVFININF